MEDIIEENNGVDQPMQDEREMEEEEDVETVRTIQSKMGGEEIQIRDLIHKQYQEFFKDTPDALDDEDELEKYYTAFADKIFSSLKSDNLGEWNIAVGTRFNNILSLLSTERHASFKIGRINVVLIETK